MEQITPRTPSYRCHQTGGEWYQLEDGLWLYLPPNRLPFEQAGARTETSPDAGQGGQGPSLAGETPLYPR